MAFKQSKADVFVDPALDITLDDPVSRGSVLFFTSSHNRAGSITSIADSKGNTWTQIGTANEDVLHNHASVIWYAEDVKAGTTVVTPTTAGIFVGITFTLSEFSEVQRIGALRSQDTNKAFANSSTGTDSVESDSIDVEVGDLVIGVFQCATGSLGSVAAGTGFTEAAEELGDGFAGTTLVEYMDAADTAVTATFTPGTADKSVAATIVAFIPGEEILPQEAAPVSDVDAGGWTPSTGGDLFAMIDESTPSDADYILSAVSPVSPDICEIAIDATDNPHQSDDGESHIISYRIGKNLSSGDQIDITVRLMMGATEIASWEHTDVDALTTYAQELSNSEANAITDYSDLRLVFESVAG
jgi:hypothetical protein